MLLLTTYGGEADAGYVLARFFQQNYAEFRVMVCGRCKSAGTLVALGATEIIMSDYGELGPLDIQLAKEDSLAARTSGLDIIQALSVITKQAFTVFEQHFLGVLAASNGIITTKTAADIATSVTSQLLAPITAQIDPLRLGEMQRAMQVASEYGKRLGAPSDAVTKLAIGYPAHSFVVDFEEATTLFPGAVRRPTGRELELEQAIRAFYLQMGADHLRTPQAGPGTQWCLTHADAVQQEIFDNGDDASEATADQLSDIGGVDGSSAGESESTGADPSTLRHRGS